MLVSARKGLLAGRFRHGPIDVSETTWTEVDANDPKVREVLLGFIPSHIRIAERQDASLREAELLVVDTPVLKKLRELREESPDELKGLDQLQEGRLLDLRTWGPKLDHAAQARHDRLASVAHAAEQTADAEDARVRAVAAITEAESAKAAAEQAGERMRADKAAQELAAERLKDAASEAAAQLKDAASEAAAQLKDAAEKARAKK